MFIGSLQKLALVLVLLSVGIIPFMTANAQPSTSKDDLSDSLPRPRLSSTDAINIAIKDLQARYLDFGNITRVVSAGGDFGPEHSSLDAFNANNGTELPLRYIHPNGTIIQIVKTDEGVGVKDSSNLECRLFVIPLCGFLPPYNLTSMQGRLVYAVSLDWTSMHNTTELIEEYYAVDATNGEIVDSWFLRRESAGDNANKYYGFIPLVDKRHDKTAATTALEEEDGLSQSSGCANQSYYKVSGLAIWQLLEEGHERLSQYMSTQHDNNSAAIPVSMAGVNPASRALQVGISAEIPQSERLPIEAYEQKIKEIIGMDIPIELVGFGRLTLD